MPATAKILLVFAGMLIAARLRLHLGLAMVLGSIALTLWSGATLHGTVRLLAAASQDRDLWLLAVITMLIELCRFVTETRNAEALMGAVQRWGGRHGRIAALIALPAVIGLIPMAAGALLSAPFVREASSGTHRPVEWKAAVNYWFRHLWEYWWPLYPGVMVAMAIFKMDTPRFVAIQIAFTPVTAAVGYFLLIRPWLPELMRPVTVQDPARLREAVRVLMPLGLVAAAMILLPMPLRWLAPGIDQANRRLLAVAIGLAGGLSFIYRDERRARASGAAGRMFSTLFRRSSLSLLGTLFGGLVFKAMLERASLLPVAAREMAESGIPVALTVAVLPFLAGLVTGLTIGYVGSAFPLVVGLASVPASGMTPAATLVLAYAAGYAGVMLSPVHLCLLMTNEYFGARLFGMYRWVAPCVALVSAFTLLLYAFLRSLGW